RRGVHIEAHRCDEDGEDQDQQIGTSEHHTCRYGLHGLLRLFGIHAEAQVIQQSVQWDHGREVAQKSTTPAALPPPSFSRSIPKRSGPSTFATCYETCLSSKPPVCLPDRPLECSSRRKVPGW